jgi:glucan biosynthesis protein C
MTARRLYHIDWLRVLAVLLLFPFHTGRVFNAGEAFYVKGPQVSDLASRVLGFIDVWHMPLLFVLAGASTYLALGQRGRNEYARERVKRLLVPFVFGILVLIPPQTWYGARFNSGYQRSYLHYLISGDFLHLEFGRDDYFGGLGTGQLWFILFLLIFSLAALPMWAGRHREDSRLIRLSRILAHPAGWLLAGLALLAAEALPDIGGKNPFYYFAFFVLGYLALCSGQFVEAARRWMWLTIPIGVAAAVWWVASADWRHSLADPSPALAGVNFLGMTTRWLLIVGLLGLGSRFLEHTSPALKYLAEASYPVYILHQTAIVVLAFYLVGMDAAWTWLWALLLAASVALTFLCYEVVRRWNWLRYLFGMRPRRGGRSLPTAARPERHGQTE